MLRHGVSGPAGRLSQPERKIVFLVGAVQFVNVLDFMIIMPLGPDLAVDLGIPSARLGWIGGSYTVAAAVAGLLGSLFLDRFDRRKALAIALFGLALATAGCTLAGGLAWLMAARMVAGAFGGPATSLAFSIVADVVPPDRRGKALGAVIGAFAVASVLGVPAGLELARRGGWQLPLMVVGALGVLVAAGAAVLLPPLRAHLEGPRSARTTLMRLLSRPAVRWSYVMTAVVMTSTFTLIPNIAAYVLFNLDYPRERLGLLYLVGGAVSFFGLRLTGRLVDSHGSFRVGCAGSAAVMALSYLWFVAPPADLPIMAVFVGFMLAMSLRIVAYNTLTSKVPRSDERARFMSIQSSIQHLAAALGAFAGARLLTELPDKALLGMPRVAGVSIALMALVPALLWIVERQVASAASDESA